MYSVLYYTIVYHNIMHATRISILSVYSTSSSLEELAQHTESIQGKVVLLVSKAKKVADGCTIQYIKARIEDKLPEVKTVSHTFNHVAKVRLRNCKG